jgi:hypothetical protein
MFQRSSRASGDSPDSGSSPKIPPDSRDPNRLLPRSSSSTSRPCCPRLNQITRCEAARSKLLPVPRFLARGGEGWSVASELSPFGAAECVLSTPAQVADGPSARCSARSLPVIISGHLCGPSSNPGADVGASQIERQWAGGPAGSLLPGCQNPSSSVSPRHRKVRFASSPMVLPFLAALPPFELGRSCCSLRPTKALKPIRLVPILKSHSTIMAPRTTAFPCNMTTTAPQEISEDWHEDQEQDTEQPWQLVRRKRWWRKEKIMAKKS